MTRVHVLGAAGYAAAEFVRYAQRHPHLELGVLESASHAGSPLADSIPALRASARTFDAAGTLEGSLESDDLVVLAGERDASREQAPKLLARGARVIDFSDAFRLAPASRGAVYGWTERYENALEGARFVANPGCYPTATLLALAPLGAFGSEIVQLIVDAKSGITGAGRKPRTELLFAEAAEDVRAYGLGGHRHEAEIEQELASLGITAPMVFTPHVVPLRRGMLSDCYAVFSREPDPAAIHAAFARAYDGNPFVRVLPADRSPSLVAVAGTVDAELHVSVAGRVVRSIAAIDNLGKGAAGQALQSINLMLGYSKECALDDRGARV
jgi:N-acetyl-gamma-glutamyl-phosphate reductase